MKHIQKIIEEINEKHAIEATQPIIPILKQFNHPLVLREFKPLFEAVFKIKFKRDFIFTTESKSFYYTLLYYFYRCENFYKSPCLIKNRNDPSFEKGLLIVGDYGVGKSSVLMTFQYIFDELCIFNPNLKFKRYTVGDLLIKYESLTTQYDKLDFYNAVSNGFLWFDDVKSEREASNFGKADLIKEILFNRDDNKKRTLLTCNFAEDDPSDYEKALEEFWHRYNARTYDRLFGMFNIIVVKGKSFRK